MRRCLDGPSTESARRRRRGLTLIEVVVAVSIIGLVAAVALPAMLDFSVGVDAGPLEQVRTLLLEARAESATGAEVEVVIVPASGRYRVVTTRGGEGSDIREGVVPLQGARVRGPEDRFRVVFRTVGMSVGDTLAAGGTRLRVESATGRITVER